MTESGQFLFIFSLGPVQGFIASARKAQDLWAGSFLLSYLIRKALDEVNNLATQYGCRIDLIFPDPAAGSKAEHALNPNRFLLHIREAHDRSVLVSMGEDLKRIVKEEFKAVINYSEKRFLNIMELPAENLADSQADQIREFLEMFWVALPFSPDESYGGQLGAVETSLAARKNCRAFSGTRPGHTLKCSLCGSRDALHESGKTNLGDVRKFWEKAELRHVVTSGEYLCRICLGKRYLPDYFKSKKLITGTGFPSTGEVAASCYKHHILNSTDRIQSEWDKFEKLALEKGREHVRGKPLPRLAVSGIRRPYCIDGTWLFKESYAAAGAARSGLDTENRKFIKQQFEKFDKTVRREGLFPTPYYGILMMDADRMGRRSGLSGSFSEHRRLSRLLSEFAVQDVPEIVEQDHLGKLIYAGGDDVLAFIALADLFAVMEGLRRRFEEKFNPAFPELAAFSVSCGVCISHYKNPFSVSLDAARQMLHQAKENNEVLSPRARDGFGIRILSHSGNIKQAFSKWMSGPGNEEPVLPQMGKLQEHLLSGLLSPAFIHHYRAECAGLCDKSGRAALPFAGEELARLMWRAIDRKRLAKMFEDSGEPVDKNTLSSKGRVFVSALCKGLFSSFNRMNRNLENFISLLEITRLICQKERS